MNLSLPDCYLITPEPSESDVQAAKVPIAATAEGIVPHDEVEAEAQAQADIDSVFLARLSDALTRGDIRLVQLRAKRATPAAFVKLARHALALCHAHHARLILNGPALAPSQAWDSALNAEADGIHLSSAALMACHARPCAAGKMVSAACHSIDQLQHAQHIGVDLVTLSPVLATLSHPDVAPLGWQRFADMIDGMLPGKTPAIYALGGMTREHIAQAKACGAHGIAAIRALW